MNGLLFLASCALFAVASAQELNIIDTARRMGIYSYIWALEESNSIDIVQNTDNITVFMPTNQAFMMVDPAVREQWRANPQFYQNMMRYHVVRGGFNSTVLKDETSYPTFAASWTARYVNYTGFSKNVQVYQGALISKFDIKASNGIIHLIDQVVTQVQNQTIMDVIKQRTDLTKIIDAVKLVANVSTALDGSANRTVTFLAPSDAAIVKMANWPAVLANNTLLTEILQYHVLPQGTWFSRGLKDQQHIATYNIKGNVTVTLEGEVLKFDKATATSVDLAATNGVAYVIDTVLMPPATREFLSTL